MQAEVTANKQAIELLKVASDVRPNEIAIRDSIMAEVNSKLEACISGAVYQQIKAVRGQLATSTEERLEDMIDKRVVSTVEAAVIAISKSQT